MKFLIFTQKSKKENSPQAAFTLIEMLVVVFVVGIGLVGALSFFNINLNNQLETKNELIAAGLAQEGADLIRNRVDFGRLRGDSWTTIATNIQGCSRIDRRSLTGVHACNNGGSESLCFANGRYEHCASDEANAMTRSLEYTYNADDSLTVECNVEWNDRTTTATDTIYENSF